MKKKIKLIVLLTLIMCMLFSLTLTASAEETKDEEFSGLSKYFSGTTLGTRYSNMLYPSDPEKRRSLQIIQYLPLYNGKTQTAPLYSTFVYWDDPAQVNGYRGYFINCSKEQLYYGGYSGAINNSLVDTVLATDFSQNVNATNGGIYYEKTGLYFNFEDTNWIPVNGYSQFKMVKLKSEPSDIYAIVKALATDTVSANDIGEVFIPYEDEEIAQECDKSLGFLQNLHKIGLVTETNEDGFPINSQDEFEWDDTYPNYDSSYDVEVFAICNLERKNWFGLGKSELSHSELTYVKKCKYNDLVAKIYNDEMNSIFRSFWDDGKNSLFTAVAWNYDYWFRISKENKYGQWTRWYHNGTPLEGKLKGDTDVGTGDPDNWIPDPEYGIPMPDMPDVGVGDGEDDARDNIVKPIDTPDSKFGIESILEWTNWFFTALKSMVASMGDLPDLINKLFGFLPQGIGILITAGIAAVVILRFLGR